jgi:hypothetical protein
VRRQEKYIKGIKIKKENFVFTDGMTNAEEILRTHKKKKENEI